MGELKNPTGNPRGGVQLVLHARPGTQRPGIFRDTSQKLGVGNPRVGNNYSLDAGEK